jgi:hypothetical protein
MARHQFLGLKTCFHTTREENRQDKSKDYYKSKGYVLSEVNLFIAIVLAVRWALREKNNIGIFYALNCFYEGYKTSLMLKRINK